MHAGSAAPAGQRDEGFSLIELLVAISIIGIIMSGLAFGITNSLTITRDSRERTVAANLASAEIDLANSIPNTNLAPGTLQRAERVGVTDFTIRRVSTWESGTPEAPACTALANSASGQGRRFLQVNVSVTWQGIGLRGPVRASTAITPSVATYTEGKGHVAVTVTDRDGQPLAGIPVTLTWNDPGNPAPPGVPRTVTTTSIGCAFFTDFDPGPYLVSVNQAGYIDSADGTQAASEQVTVGDRQTAKAGFTYDRRTGLDLTVSGDAGAVVPNGLVVTAQSVGTPSLLRTSAGGTGNSDRHTIGLIPDAGLFPYSGGWTAWAGCAHNAPDLYGGTRAGLTPAPNVPASGGVAAGTLEIDILTRDAARSAPRRLYAQDQTATGAPCNALVEVGSFDADGRLTGRSVVLPFGNWRLFAEGSVVALNGDPDKAAAGGLIEVRPGATATYREPPAYLPEVLADSPFLYYRLDESPAYSTADSSGNNRTGAYQSGVVRGLSSFSATADRSVYLDGRSNSFVSTPTTFTNPNTFTLEVWFRTPSNGYALGGRLVGFGDQQSVTSSTYDRHLYMLNTGELVFGVYPNPARVVQSTNRYNDGEWHHAVATFSPGAMVLYVDNVLVDQRADITTAQNYTGFLRVGYDNLSSGWPGAHTNIGFQGFIDEFAFYTSALSQTRVSAHWDARAGSGYPGAVSADAPQLYYRFNDSAFALDSSGNQRVGAYQGGATGGAGSALLNDANTAMGFNGTADAYVTNTNFTQVTSPSAFSLELWLRTTTTTGGRLLGFGNALTGTSTTYDRHLYMQNNGRISFSVNPTTRRHASSSLATPYNDGEWHHVVATFGPAGQLLYVDGVLVETDANTNAGTPYGGYWRVGADTLTGSLEAPTSTGFNGQIDEVAVYTSVLSAQRVAAHYAASGR